MGTYVSNEGVCVDPHKKEAITKSPRPKNATEVRSFMGLAGSYHRFAQNFSKIGAPFTNLTWKVTEYE